jgi:SET domain-containing protein
MLLPFVRDQIVRVWHDPCISVNNKHPLRSPIVHESAMSKVKNYEVRKSPVHGNGVFALRAIGAGERIIEYRGERISWDHATDRAAERGGPINHTFYFSLADGNVIDGGSRGNDARWINHACEPNCEAFEEDGRVYIHAMRDIDQGEELNYNYALIYDERHTPALKRLFACRCGTPGCSGTMLAPKRRAKKPAAAGTGRPA